MNWRGSTTGRTRPRRRIGAPHPGFGADVRAVAASTPGAILSEPAALDALARPLAPHRLTRRALFTDAPPRHALGKAPKQALGDAFEGPYARRGPGGAAFA